MTTNNTTVLYLYTKLQKILEQAGTGYIINIIKQTNNNVLGVLIWIFHVCSSSPAGSLTNC